MAVVNVYKVPITPPTNVVDKKLYECNAKSKNTILSGLADLEFTKVMQCSSTK